MTKKIRALLVEDNRGDVDLIQDMLSGIEAVSFQLGWVTHLSDALVRVKSRAFDVIFLDLRLPDSQGLTSFRAIHDAAPDIPIIILTGNVDQEVALSAVREGAQDYLIKGEFNGHLLFQAAVSAVERNKVEKALRLERDRAQKYLDIAGVMFVALDQEGDVTLINRKGSEILGLGQADIIGKNWFDNFVPERVRDQVRSVYDQLVAGALEPVEYYENPVLTKNGEERILLWHNAVLRDKEARIIGTLSSGEDITVRKRTEEALRASEEKYRILHEFAGEAIFTFGPDLRLIEINRAACDFIGRERHELIGLEVFDLGILHPEDVSLAVESIQKIINREKSIVVIKLRFKGKTGLYSIFQVTATPVLRNDEIVAITNVCRDVTQEERLYQALEESERKYKFLFDAGNDSIYVFQLNEQGRPGRFIEANEIACQRYGYTKEEMLNISPLELAAPERRAEIGQALKRLREEKHLLFEWEHITKDGRKFPVEISSHFFEWNGVPTVLSMVRDITKRKKAEENLKAALEEKNILLREIHHRVKNNMQIISSLLRLQSRRISDEEARKVFSESQTQIRSMAMIHESLYQSKDFSRVAFANYIEKMVTHLFAVYKVDTRRVAFKLDVEGVNIEVDRAIPCALILNELVSNALKYAFAQEKKGELLVRMFRDELGQSHLIVKDSGPGIPEGVDIRKPQTLGLQIVTDLTRQLDGKIELRRDRGTEFEITF